MLFFQGRCSRTGRSIAPGVLAVKNEFESLVASLDSFESPLSGLDPEGVHEMRVALRRMRATVLSAELRQHLPLNRSKDE